MKIATLLFTYNRSHHTEAVLKALSQNSRRPEKMVIFQDGLKTERDLAEWQRVNELIGSIDWCDTEMIVSERNKGLAASIISGIAYAFQEYDAVIVLEDDCVPAPAFMDFMQQCLGKYQDNNNVHSVSGYAYPVSLKKGMYDVYACGRISSWGWGTWKDRWEHFAKDYELVRRMKQEETSSRNLAIWGNGLENMLVGNIRGTCDSWAVFWALDAIIREKICLNPYESLIQNIGCDNSGVHCGDTRQWNVALAENREGVFCLPDEIRITNEEVKAFIPLFGSYTALNYEEGKREKILIYGLGNFYLRNERKICEEYYIRAFIDRGKNGWYAGKKIIKKEEIFEYKFDRILIMIQNVEDCLEVKNHLTDCGLEPEKILIGQDLYE